MPSKHSMSESGFYLARSFFCTLVLCAAQHITASVADQFSLAQLAPQRGRGVAIALWDTDFQTVHGAHMRGIITGTNAVHGIAPNARIVPFETTNSPSVQDLYTLVRTMYADNTITIMAAPITIMSHASLFSLTHNIKRTLKRTAPLFIVRAWSQEEGAWLDGLGSAAYQICSQAQGAHSIIDNKKISHAYSVPFAYGDGIAAPLVDVSPGMIKKLGGNSPATALFAGFLALIIGEFGTFFSPYSIDAVVRWSVNHALTHNNGILSMHETLFLLHCLYRLCKSRGIDPELLINNNNLALIANAINQETQHKFNNLNEAIEYITEKFDFLT